MARCPKCGNEIPAWANGTCYNCIRYEREHGGQSLPPIWPVLERLVERHGSVSRDSLSDQIGIKMSQAEAWIKRALEEDKLVRKNKPVRYVFPDPDQEVLLDDST